MRRWPLLVPAALVVTGAVILFVPAGPPGASGARPAPAADPAILAKARTGDLAGMIAEAEARRRARPGDPAASAALGSLYVEKAQLSADPAAVRRAGEVLAESLRLAPGGNLDAYVGRARLAVVTHDFAGARDWALKATALAGRHGPALAALTDAYVNLGDYGKAGKTLQRLLDHAPGVAAFTRAAHYFDLTGRPRRAGEALTLALDAALLPGDVALTLHRAGEVAARQGRHKEALQAFTEAVAVVPGYLPALVGRARSQAALGRVDLALRDYADAVGRAPQPHVLLELGGYYHSLGRAGEARQQFEVLAATARLGEPDDLTLGRYHAEHGDPAVAVRHLRRELGRRESVEVADAMAWALHKAGRHREAMTYAGRAARTGMRDATFAFHRGEIARALGDVTAARRHLQLALKTDPHFGEAEAARRALAVMGAH
ncbi:tetratricopeptide repeat protein [Sinosporangium siamense]|uniref:Tetratricopeptide repeat protein n=1 Tax=Sinosporangium siamense TaxID=1367973 RepID=A0A919RDB0_9ACTN|nr:tetratricopeptide repeat protein [Sinosporangium siamense]GII91821.1 hypothetical protein Ssi02_20520 [Sinosporangium siamense]